MPEPESAAVPVMLDGPADHAARGHARDGDRGDRVERVDDDRQARARGSLGEIGGLDVVAVRAVWCRLAVAARRVVREGLPGLTAGGGRGAGPGRAQDGLRHVEHVVARRPLDCDRRSEHGTRQNGGVRGCRCRVRARRNERDERRGQRRQKGASWHVTEIVRPGCPDPPNDHPFGGVARSSCASCGAPPATREWRGAEKRFRGVTLAPLAPGCSDGGDAADG